jgi:hypothetical protein
MGWPQVSKTKTPQAFWRPAAIGLVKVLSQPQVRADRAKPIKEILAAGCVVHWLAVHEAKVTERNPQSSREAAGTGGDYQFSEGGVSQRSNLLAKFWARKARPSEQNQTLNLNSSTSPSLTT